MFAAAGGLAAALPRELDANAVVPVGVGGVGAANDDGGQRAAGGWPGVDAAAVGIGTQRLPGDVGTEGGDPVAIEVDTVFFSAFLIGVAVRVGGRGKQVQGITRFVGDGGDEKLAVFLGVTIMLGVVGQHEGGAGGGTADVPGRGGIASGVRRWPGVGCRACARRGRCSARRIGQGRARRRCAVAGRWRWHWQRFADGWTGCGSPSCWRGCRWCRSGRTPCHWSRLSVSSVAPAWV